jgi:phosphatidylglycerol---prolipoprotein diacylglyceryl transferase
MLPILWQAGPFAIPTHDAFSLLAVVVGLAIYYAELRRRGWLDERIVVVSLAVLLGGVIGARTITAWERVDEYGRVLDAGVPLTFALLHGGKSIIGAVAGGYLGGVLAKRALGYTRSTGDAYVLALPIAAAIGRLGCFLAELPLGTATRLPWGISVDAEAAAAFPRCPDCDLPMHPSMLYEIGFNLVAIAVIVWARPRVPVQGDLLKAYLLAAAVFRFGVESVRGNEVQALGLTGPQLVLVPLVILLLAHFARQLRRGVYHVPEAPPATATAAADG